MGKSKAKERLDKYYHLAKEQGYRSRASFKLIQIDAKYSFLSGAHAVLDLCAAPGGWMQVAVQRVPVGSLVVGIDLFPIRPVRGAIAVTEDITKSKCRAVIKKHLSENGFKAFDVVLHDGSPNIGGAWSQEATSQNSLVIDSIKLATEFLALKGTFVTKVFRSQDYNNVLYCLRQLFERVEVIKPPASRSSSAEIFVVGLKYKAPAKIDPRLLDVKHLFLGATEPPKVLDVLRDSKQQKRHRDGYADDISLVRKSCTAADFVWADNPLDLLGTVTSISFKDPASVPIKEQKLTTEEVEALCDDLRVLSKQDFKHLLKWRTNIRKALSAVKERPSTNMESDTQKKDEDEKDKDEVLLDEMEVLTSAIDRKKKRQKKIVAKRHAKEKARKALGTQIDAMEDGYIDNELFTLASIKGKRDLATVGAPEDGEDGSDVDDENQEMNERSDGDLSSDLESDEERNRYDNKLEELLDEAYERVVSKREGSTRQRKRAKQAYEDGRLEDDDVKEPVYDSDMDDDQKEDNPLVVPFNDRPPTEEEVTAQWFSQDVFAEAVDDIKENGQEKGGDSDDEMEVDRNEHPKTSLPKKVAKENAKPEKFQNGTKLSEKSKKALKVEDDYEVVPAPATDSSSDDSSSDDSSDEYDVETKAEILAYAKKMLRKKKRDEIIDDGYHRYMFDDDVKGLPKWFVEEEQKHRVPVKPVSKDEIAAMKAQFKEIDTRPVKKVAEAKARKKRAAMRKMEKIRKKANSISDQSDLPDRSKQRMIDQLYKKATPKKPKREFVVAKKGVQVRPGKGKTLVDRRMKKDARKVGMTKDKKKGGKKNAKSGGKGRGGPVKGGGRKGKGGRA